MWAGLLRIELVCGVAIESLFARFLRRWSLVYRRRSAVFFLEAIELHSAEGRFGRRIGDGRDVRNAHGGFERFCSRYRRLKAGKHV